MQDTSLLQVEPQEAELLAQHKDKERRNKQEATQNVACFSAVNVVDTVKFKVLSVARAHDQGLTERGNLDFLALLGAVFHSHSVDVVATFICGVSI